MADQFDPRAWTRDHEGFRDEVYLDSRGLPTVGVGHLITKSSPYYGLKVGDKVDPAKLEAEYEKDYKKHEKMAQKNFKNFSKHPKHVQDALVNMTFQLGNKPKKWSNFQAALDKGDYQSAALHGSESDWYHDQTPKRAKSVLDRLAYGSDYSYDRPAELDERPAYAPPERLGLASGALTNPEAGPSDTVPAMLTPGEAVIPASVAQDPEFKPAIEEMVDEGRERNRSAEFLGIPVNHAAAARPPGEQQGYMGGVPHVDGFADGIGGAFDKLLPESVKDNWQEAKDTKTGVEDAYKAYKWLDEKDAQLRDMSGGYLGIPTWQDPINWELVSEYGDEALKGARTYGKYKRKAGEVLDAIGLADGTLSAHDRTMMRILGKNEKQYRAYQKEIDEQVKAANEYATKWMEDNPIDFSGGGLDYYLSEPAVAPSSGGYYVAPTPSSTPSRSAPAASPFIGFGAGSNPRSKANLEQQYRKVDRNAAFRADEAARHYNNYGGPKPAADRGGIYHSTTSLNNSSGWQGGSTMIPRPMGAPPKYNIDRPDHSEFNVAADQMGDGMKMDLTNAKHRQQVANKEGDHAQKMQHEKEAAAQKMQLDQMKAEQKLMNDQQSEGMKLQMKVADSDVEGMLTQQKQAALDASINGMGFFEDAAPPQPMAPPPGGLFDGSTVVGQNQIAGYADGMVGGRPSVVNGEYRGYADGTKSGAQAQQINDLLAAGVSMEDIKKYLGAQLGAVGDEFVSQPAPPVAQPAPPPQQAPAPTPSNPYQQALGDIQQVAMAQQRRQNATRDIARQAFGAEEEAHAWQSGIDNLQGRADGGTISKDNDIIVDGQFMSSHVPPIQGLADGGVPNATAGNLDQTDVKGFQNLLFNSGVATAEEAYVDPEYAAREARYKAVEEANKMKKAEAQMAAGQQASQANQQMIDEADKVINDPTADPNVKADAAKQKQQAEQANMDNDRSVKQGAEAKLGIVTDEAAKQAGVTDTGPSQVATPAGEVAIDEAYQKDLDDWAADRGEYADATQQAKTSPPEEKKGWIEAMKGAIGNLTDQDSLATAALVYGANRLLGFDHDTAGGEALKFHNASVERRLGGEAAAVEAQQELQTYDAKQAIETKYNILENEAKESPKAAKELAKTRKEDLAKGRVAGEKVAKAGLDSYGTSTIKGKYGDTKQRAITLTAPAAGAQYEAFLKDITPQGGFIAHNDPKVVQAMDNAMRAAVNHARETGEDIQDLTPFLWAAYIPESTGRGAKDFEGIGAKRMGELTSGFGQIPGKSPGESVQLQVGKAQEAYARLAQANPKAFNEYEAKKPNGFYNFVRDIQAGKKVI